MKLMSISLQGYRRFEATVELDVAGSVIALIGPNEAGKSSLLRAMLSCNTRDAFDIKESTRGSQVPTSVECGYVLDRNDQEALAHLPGGTNIKWWTLDKRQDGGYFYDLNPDLSRDLTSRHDTARRLAQFLKTEPVAHWNTVGGIDVAQTLDHVNAFLRSTADSLTQNQVIRIQQFGAALLTVSVSDDDDDDSESFSSSFHSFLETLASYDEGPSPSSTAASVLISRRPTFVLFGPADRELLDSYDLTDVAVNPPAALSNLAQLAGLNLAALLDAQQTNNVSAREHALELANARLAGVFGASWKQSRVTIRLSVQSTILQLIVSLPEGAGYTPIEDRSSGLLWFVALRAFLASKKYDQLPVLLVDEAETHLHYDAQAEIVELFTNQDVASKVIYTTHSAGCLPRDLGTGIRVVEPLAAIERSTIRKSIWRGQNAGFTPLMFAMGATAFAFLPAKHVLLAEGETDAMLYPSLFREAGRLEVLPFQVAPGLSSVQPAKMLGLTSEGGNVRYIVDGDSSGSLLLDQLTSQGVLKRHQFSLREVFEDGMQLEDLISPELYCSSVNDTLRTFQDLKTPWSVDLVPSTGRTAALHRWCLEQGLKPPMKVDIAQHLLDTKAEAAREAKTVQLLATEHSKQLSKLLTKITKSLETPRRRPRHR